MQEILYSITPQSVLMVVFVGTTTLIGLMAGLYVIHRIGRRDEVRHAEVSAKSTMVHSQEELQVAIPPREVASEMQDMSSLPVQGIPKTKAPQKRIKKIIVR